MKKNQKIENPKYPNNLHNLMKRDGITAVDISKAWNTERGDVSQRLNGKVSITPIRRKILFEKFGWNASEVYGDIPVENHRDKLREAEVALIYVVKEIIDIVMGKKEPTKKALINDFGYALDCYRDQESPSAIAVIEALLAHIKDDEPVQKQHRLQQMLWLSPPKSQAVRKPVG